MSQSSRKRRRNRTDDKDGEFMPISKRINNLHIRSGLLNGESEGQGGEPEVTTCGKCHAMATTCPDHLFAAAASNGHTFAHGAASTAGPSTSTNGMCGPVSPHEHQNFATPYLNGHQHDPYHQMQQQQQQQQLEQQQQQHHLQQQQQQHLQQQQHQHLQQQHLHHLQQQQQGQCADHSAAEQRHSMYQDAGGSSEGGGGSGMQAAYEPDMDQNDNPFYYQVNGLLYELHIARTMRHSKM